MAEITSFIDALRKRLTGEEAAALGLRLLLARRLELEVEAERRRRRAELPHAAPRELRDAVRAAVRSYPRDDDALERLAGLPPEARGPALGAHLNAFTGPFGERLRDGGAALLAKFAEPRELDALLEALLGLELDPDRLTESGYEAVERELFAACRGVKPEGRDAVWARSEVAAPKPETLDGAGGAPGASAPDLLIEAVYDGRLNWATERNGVPVVHEVRLINRSPAPLADLTLSIAIAPDFSQPFTAAVPAIEPGAVWTLTRPDVRLNGPRLRAVIESEKAGLEIVVARPSGETFRFAQPVEVLAVNEWNARSIPELLAAFVLPNHPAVQKVLEAARDRLQADHGRPDLDGYQSKSFDRVRAMAKAVYQAVQKLGITYVNPPASFEESGQKIRLPAQVLEHRMGTCLDLTLLMAAALEQCGLNALVVLEQGHALPGVWLLDDWLPTAAGFDADTVRKLVAAGDIVLFDSSSAARVPAVSFEAAAETALNDLVPRFQSVVDLRAARRAGILPLPLGGTPGEILPEVPLATPTTRLPETAPTTPGGLPPTRAKEPQRIAAWKQRLLDLSLRNRLLAFAESRDRSVPLDCPDLATLEDRLAIGDSLILEPRIELTDELRSEDLAKQRGAEQLIEAERKRLLAQKRIPTLVGADELARRLVLIARASRSELEETGSSTLYLAIGMLKWFESAESTKVRKAPILLYPVELVRSSSRASFRLRMRDDEPRMNDTLFEKLRIDFGLGFDELKDLPVDEKGVDVAFILKTLQRTAARLPRFDVLFEAYLGFFSFSKFLMWSDLDRSLDHLLRNDLVRHLVGLGEPVDKAAFDGRFPDPRALDAVSPPTRAKLVLDADSSQHAAVEAALAGKSFVLQGPPGTGKSQTIANVIAGMLAAGKRVLFVAEKRAALEVVAKRLANTGLGDACLELHSNKAVKREVVLELARVLEAAEEGGGDAHAEAARRAETELSKLRGYADALHQKGRAGFSHFEALSRLVELRKAPVVKARYDAVLETDAQLHRRRLEALVEIGAAAADVAPLAKHPFGAFRLGAWSLVQERAWIDVLTALRQAAEKASDAATALARLAGVGPGVSMAALECAAPWVEAIGRGIPAAVAKLLADPHLEQSLARLDAFDAALRRWRTAWTALEPRWERSLLDLDLEGLRGVYREKADSFVVLRWFALKGPKVELARAARAPLGEPKAVLADLEAAVLAREISRSLATEQAFAATYLGPAAMGEKTDPDVVARILATTRLYLGARDEVAARAAGAVLSFGETVRPDEAAATARRFKEAMQALRAAYERAARELGFEAAVAFGGAIETAALRDQRSASDGFVAAAPHLRPWSRFIAAENAAVASGLGGLAGAFRRGDVAAEDLGAAYEREFLTQWAEARIESDPGLRGFDSKTFEAAAARYRDFDKETVRTTGPSIARALSELRPKLTGLQAPTSEVGILQREAKKKTRHMALRRLLEEIPNLLPRLKPCLLMSPLSIAQYLPAARDPFDLVIFDEASQIATHDAVGAIARGRQVIVVGDSRQLPPTTFFATDVEVEDEAAIEGEGRVAELESILDECVAAQVPAMMLLWHYRSRDESLIAFSNRHYYDDKLNTFPAARGGRDSGVSLVRTQGPYDRAKSHTNRNEAEAVAQWIVEALRDPGRRDRSIGVVTFNMQQQTLIEDLLDQAIKKHPEIEAYFDDRAPEPVFVKNLENVQGDERDVMLFSITYGPDADGRVYMNFGPLNRSGGERRLNVAVTRARERLVVFSSLDPEQIDLRRTLAKGAEHLKAFLRYAAEGQRSLAGGARSGAKSGAGGLEKDIQSTLEARGYAVAAAVGCSAYRMDVGVKSKDDADRFVLGIETDGAAYYGAATVRERERLRSAVLRGLGWTVERVWSFDWWHDRDGALARLETKIAAAAAAPTLPRGPGANEKLVVPSSTANDEPTPAAIESKGVAAKKAPADEVAVYARYRHPATSSPEVLLDVKRTAEHVELLRAVVGVEGPIHRDLLFERLARAFDVGRLTARYEDRLVAFLDEAVRREHVQVLDEFVWGSDADPAAYSLIRGRVEDGEEARELEYVPPQEMAAAIRRVLAESIALPRPDLARAAVALFGFKRLTVKAQSSVERGLTLLFERGHCRNEGDRVRLA